MKNAIRLSVGAALGLLIVATAAFFSGPAETIRSSPAVSQTLVPVTPLPKNDAQPVNPTAARRPIVAVQPPVIAANVPLHRSASRAQIFGEKPLTDLIPGDRVTLHLSPTADLPIVITSAAPVDPSGEGGSFAARIPGVPFGRVAISTFGDAVYASINGAELGDFEIRRSPGSDRLEVRRLTAADDLGCANDHQLTDTDTDTDAISSSTDENVFTKAITGGATIDVAVFFNDQSRVVLGGAPGNPADDADVRAKIATAITDANSALADSNVPTTLRAVYVAPISYVYPPGEDLDRALNELRSTTDGAIDQVHALRDASKADIVSLWIENSVGGGKANLNLPSNIGFKNAFNVIRAQNPTSTFVHEIGHNHGCRHLRSGYPSTPSSWAPDSFAHFFTTGGGGRFATVVASTSDASNNTATRILRISAPELAYLGSPTGVTGSTNNAAAFRASGPLLANFRGGPDTTPPVIGLKSKPRIKTRRSRLTLRGTATDDVAIGRVIYKATGKRGLSTAKGLRLWRLKVRLKKRRTIVKVFAIDTTNNRSTPQKVKIIKTR